MPVSRGRKCPFCPPFGRPWTSCYVKGSSTNVGKLIVAKKSHHGWLHIDDVIIVAKSDFYHPRNFSLVAALSSGERSSQNDEITKIYQQWQGPMKRARVNNFMKWDRGWWHAYTKQAFSSINRKRRLGSCPRSPCAGVATGLLKTPSTQLKKQAKMTQYWYLF